MISRIIRIKNSNKIRHNIKCILDSLNIEVPEKEINVEVPANKKNGDYATNIALVLARTLKERPMDIAKEILPLFDQKLFDNIFIAEPGFINLVISMKVRNYPDKYIINYVVKVLTMKR